MMEHNLEKTFNFYKIENYKCANYWNWKGIRDRNSFKHAGTRTISAFSIVSFYPTLVTVNLAENLLSGRCLLQSR